MGLVLLDEKIFNVLHVSNSSLSSLIDVLEIVKSRKKYEIISRYEDQIHQIIQELLKKNKKNWIDFLDPFYKSSRDEKILKSIDKASHKLKKEEEILIKLLEKESNKKYEN